MARVLFCYQHHTEPRRAAGVHGHHLVEALRRRGHELLTIERVSDGRLRRWPANASGARSALAAADVVYARVAARPSVLALLEWNRRSLRRPVVMELNAPPEETFAYGTGPEARVRVALRRLAYHRLVGRADAVVCVSQTLAEHVARAFPEQPARLRVVPNGGNPAREPARSREGFHVAWAGGPHHPWQALDRVREVARRLVARVPHAVVHVFAGRPAGIGSGPGLRVHSPRSNARVVEALATMDAALCLYRVPPRVPAGFYLSPLKLFEAMAAGLPVVASRLGQIADVVEPGRSGWLVGADPEEAVRALETLAQDETRRRAMGRAALDRIRGGYTWGHTGARIDALLDDVLAGRSGAVNEAAA